MTSHLTLSSEYGKYKTVKARFWLWLSGESHVPRGKSAWNGHGRERDGLVLTFGDLCLLAELDNVSHAHLFHARSLITARKLPDAIERIWHIKHGQGQILALAFKNKVASPAGTARVTGMGENATGWC